MRVPSYEQHSYSAPTLTAQETSFRPEWESEPLAATYCNILQHTQQLTGLPKMLIALLYMTHFQCNLKGSKYHSVHIKNNNIGMIRHDSNKVLCNISLRIQNNLESNNLSDNDNLRKHLSEFLIKTS